MRMRSLNSEKLHFFPFGIHCRAEGIGRDSRRNQKTISHFINGMENTVSSLTVNRPSVSEKSFLIPVRIPFDSCDLTGRVAQHCWRCCREALTVSSFTRRRQSFIENKTYDNSNADGAYRDACDAINDDCVRVATS